jgi:hypothetical protein
MTFNHQPPRRRGAGAGTRTSFVTRYGATVGLASTLLAMIATASAQRSRFDNDRQGLPVATNRILQEPETYYGKLVTVSAGVEQVLSKTAFVLDQQRKIAGTAEVTALGQPVLVIAPYLTGHLEEKSYLWVRGEVVKFDPAAFARVAPDYTMDLPAEIAARYQGQPVVVASSVIDSSRAELGKKPYPPPTPEEVSLGAAMKTIGPAFAALQAAAKDSNVDGVAESAVKLQPAFTDVEAIWEDLGQTAAAEWARSARDSAASIEKAVAAGNWDGAKSSAQALNRLCQNCHGSYRDRQDDGAFRIRPGSF